MITLLICRNCSFVLPNRSFDNPAIQVMHSRATNERFERMSGTRLLASNLNPGAGGSECTSWLISGHVQTPFFDWLHKDLRSSGFLLEIEGPSVPAGYFHRETKLQQIDLDLESNKTCLRDVFSLSVCSMNAILACFDVLAVLTLKLAKMAFIGQKLTIIRKQHKYWPLYEIAVNGLSILSLGHLWYFYGNVIYIQLDFRKRTEKHLPANWWEKGKKAVFFASDDKAENHIDEGEGKKILRARKMKGRSRREQPRPRAFHAIFWRQNPWAKVGEEKKTRVALLVFILATISATFSKIQLDQAHWNRIVYGGSYEQQIWDG